MIKEAVAEPKDAGKPIFMTFMDAKNTFDVVWHSSALVALNQQGVKGPLWNSYVDMYGSVSAVVDVDGNLSREIREPRYKTRGPYINGNLQGQRKPYARPDRIPPRLHAHWLNTPRCPSLCR